MRLSKDWVLVFLLVPILSYGQLKWTTIHLDENVSFNIPSEYKKIDTLGQDNFLAKTAFAYIQAIKIPQPQAQIKNKKELIDYYKAFQKLTIDQSSGDLVSDSTIESNNLYVRVFQFETFWNDSLEIQENKIAFIDNSIYSFTYAYFKDEEQQAKGDKDIFFSGVNFQGNNLKDQLTIMRNKNEEVGESVGYIMRYIIITTVLMAVILLFLKKYQWVKSIVNILSLGLLTWGTVCIFLYVANILMDKNFDSLLMIGLICLIIGFVLRKVKLPLTK